MYMIAYPLGECTEQKQHNMSNHGPFRLAWAILSMEYLWL